MNRTSDIRNDTEKDPATLEREIDQTRAQMDQTISALGRKFSPGQLLDEALGMVREHGGEFAANLNNTVKQNPVPVILSTVGIAWMMLSNNRSNRSVADRDEYEHGYDYETTDGDHTADQPGMLAGAGQRIKDSTEATRQKLASSKEALTSRVSKTAGSAQAQARRAREGFDNLLEDQPLILGALGVALGAVIGAMLPATEQEDRLFGPLRDRTMSEVKQRGEESYSKVRESVSRETFSQAEERSSRTDTRREKDASAA